MALRNKNVPDLRFKEFHDSWKTIMLGEVCDTFSSGETITSKNIFDSGNFPVYGGNGLRGYTDSYTHEGFYVLIGRQGALCGNINRVYGKTYISEHAIAVASNDSSDTEWLAQKLDYMNLNRLSESSAQPGLAVNKLIKIKITLPSLPEQQKIASFLYAIDEKIRQLTRKKELLEQYKKGVMQQLFSGKLRFKDEQGKAFPKWEEKLYEDIFTFYTTNSLSREKLNYESGSVKNIHYGDIHTKFKTLFDLTRESVPFINDDVDLSKVKAENYCQEGDLVIADASEDYTDIGKSIELVNLNKLKVVAGLHTFLARPAKSKMYKGFSGYFVQAPYVRKQIMTIAQGTKVLSLSPGRLGKVKLQIPSIEEQQKIASFLSNIDTRTERVNAQIEGTKMYKKGLLQQMFV